MSGRRLLTTLSDAAQLKSYALELLAAPATDVGLSVLLFLLDGVVFLRSARELATRRRLSESVGLGFDRGDEADIEEAAGARRQTAANAAADDAESWEEWVAYVAEMVSFPVMDITERGRREY